MKTGQLKKKKKKKRKRQTEPAKTKTKQQKNRQANGQKKESSITYKQTNHAVKTD